LGVAVAREKALSARMARLQEVTAALSEALTAGDVIIAAVDRAVSAMGARTGSLWLVDNESSVAQLKHSAGDDKSAVEAFAQIPLEGSMPMPVSDVVRTGKPTWIESSRELKKHYPQLAASIQPATRNYSFACLPMKAEARCIGALVFTFDVARKFSDGERFFLLGIAWHSAQALERARSFESERQARQDAEADRRRAAFLAEAGALLSSSLEYDARLRSLVQLAVPRIADWCIVDLVEGPGTSSRIAIAHADPSKGELARQLRHSYPLSPSQPLSVINVLRTGESELYPTVSGPSLTSTARDEEQANSLRSLGLRSAMLVPMRARDKTIGVITFAFAESGRHYTAADLETAKALAQRTALAVDNARLYEEAQNAIRVREDVLAIVSHDLRTPLTSIFTAATLLRRAADKKDLGQVLRNTEVIHRAGNRMSALIRDLLDVVNIELGRFAINRQRQDLQGLVREAVEAHEALAKAKSIQLTASVEGDSPSLWCDRDRLLQILSNLLGNAIKFTPEGGRVSVEVKPNSNQVTFVVKDTGIGIPEEERGLIFERYWKATQKDRRGVGIGLYIAKAIVEAHQGKISVESKPGEGASFVFVLPGSELSPASAEILEGALTIDPREKSSGLQGFELSATKH
jgi:signal transduction histidine kinase